MDLKELQERQGWSLSKKIDHALFTIFIDISIFIFIGGCFGVVLGLFWGCFLALVLPVRPGLPKKADGFSKKRSVSKKAKKADNDNENDNGNDNEKQSLTLPFADQAVRKVMQVTGNELPDESGEIFFPMD